MPSKLGSIHYFIITSHDFKSLVSSSIYIMSTFQTHHIVAQRKSQRRFSSPLKHDSSLFSPISSSVLATIYICQTTCSHMDPNICLFRDSSPSRFSRTSKDLHSCSQVVSLSSSSFILSTETTFALNGNFFLISSKAGTTS